MAAENGRDKLRGWRVTVAIALPVIIILLILSLVLPSLQIIFLPLEVLAAMVAVLGMLTIGNGGCLEGPAFNRLRIAIPVLAVLVAGLGVWWVIASR